MGSACCSEAKDEHDKTYKGDNKKQKPEKMDPRLEELMREAEKHQDQIAKI